MTSRDHHIRRRITDNTDSKISLNLHNTVIYNNPKLMRVFTKVKKIEIKVQRRVGIIRSHSLPETTEFEAN